MTDQQFADAGLDWPDLEAIYDEHETHLDELRRVGTSLRDDLESVAQVSLTRLRVKASERLIAKIIRKRIENPTRKIDIQTYRDQITDLVGVRAIHLFREDWTFIHQWLVEQYDHFEDPVANVREGDVSTVAHVFHENGWKVNPTAHGYRSLHYILRVPLGRRTHLVEVQVRTIFDEAWGEIDHALRYPDERDDVFLQSTMTVLNRLSGTADEMADAVRALYNLRQADKRDLEHTKRELEALRARPIESGSGRADEGSDDAGT